VKNIVVIGGSYIGVEAASSLKLGLKDAANITVVSGGNQIYHNTVGSEVGRGLRVLSERNGVNFELGSRLASIESDEEGNAKTVVLENGKKLDADLVILGTGVTPNTWFLEGGVALDADGGINADPFLRSTSHKDVYAAGDIVSYPYFYTAERVRNEHISEAISTGSYAAKNMLGKMVPYDQVPFFWTRAFNKSISYVGNISAYDNVSA
jgi:NADPH-dependent 2,4-dienoyl-CoA reductase/sulfur reductase-like enzyme